MITLVIHDMQSDFITGTMSFKAARTILEPIKKFIKEHQKEIDKIIFTINWHPYNHKSFKNFGGTLQSHCVQYTPGACIEPKLLKFIHRLNIPYSVSIRGEIEDLDQVGAFNDVELVSDVFGDIYYIESIVSANANTDFVICGVSVEGSMETTLLNMLDSEIIPKVYMPGIISPKNTIASFIKENNIKKYE